MDYGFGPSFEKFFNIVAFTTTTPISWNIIYGLKHYTFNSTGVQSLKLGNSFFRDDKCLACGRCCQIGFNLFLTESDFIDNPEKDIFEQLEIPYIKIYTAINNRNCPFQNGVLCTIQQEKPIHCQFPHIKVRLLKTGGLLYKAPYSRRWAKKPEERCPIDSFGLYTEYGKEQDISILQHLVRIQRDLNLDTSLVEGAISKLRRLECHSAQLTLI